MRVKSERRRPSGRRGAAAVMVALAMVLLPGCGGRAASSAPQPRESVDALRREARAQVDLLLDPSISVQQVIDTTYPPCRPGFMTVDYKRYVDMAKGIQALAGGNAVRIDLDVRNFVKGVSGEVRVKVDGRDSRLVDQWQHFVYSDGRWWSDSCDHHPAGQGPTSTR